LAALACMLPAYAQEDEYAAQKERANLPYRELNVDLIPGRLLYNKVMPFANVYGFNGRNDTAITTLASWEQMHMQMQYSSFDNFVRVTNHNSLPIHCNTKCLPKVDKFNRSLAYINYY